jgi:hypothetical protein
MALMENNNMGDIFDFAMIAQSSETQFKTLHPMVAYNNPNIMEFHNDIRNWLAEYNITDVAWNTEGINGNWHHYILKFKNLDEAMLFKLKWL